jgi:Fe-S-cluster containining protein
MKPSFTFTCTRCGSCCKEEGFVFFTSVEIDKASELLGIGRKDFISRFLIKNGGTYAHEVRKGGQCVFLKGSVCDLQSVKPEQCRTFPFWDEYIGKDGELINFDRPCRGIFGKRKPRS